MINTRFSMLNHPVQQISKKNSVQNNNLFECSKRRVLTKLHLRKIKVGSVDIRTCCATSLCDSPTHVHFEKKKYCNNKKNTPQYHDSDQQNNTRKSSFI